MNYQANRFSLVVAALIVAAQTLPPLAAQSGRPKTIHDLILELGEKPKKATQLRLKLEGQLVAKNLGDLPKSIEIEVFYDEAGNRIRVVDDAVYASGAKKKTTSLGTKERALIWIERTAPAPEVAPPMEVRSVDAALALPNPWRLPVKLGYTGMFADSVLGYEALGREYARSSRLKREPDERGLMWFDLRPSPGAGTAMRYEFNAGLKVKAGFAADSGWLEEMVVDYANSDAVMTLRVVERETELSEEELASFAFPEKVLEAYKNRPKYAPGPDPTAEPPSFNPLPRLEKKGKPATDGDQ
jgi:hypothetical protein